MKPLRSGISFRSGLLLFILTEILKDYYNFCVQHIRSCKKPIDNQRKVCYNKTTKKRTPVRGNPHHRVEWTTPAGRVAFLEKEIRSMRSPNI